MANKIILSWNQPESTFKQFKQQNLYNSILSAGINAIEAPLIDEVTVNLNTSFKRVSQILPNLGAAQSAFNAQNAIQGKMTKLQSLFDLQIWDNTEPISLDFEVLFYTITNSFSDVYIPAISLSSLSVLTKVSDSSFEVPGVSLSNAQAFIGNKNEDGTLGSGASEKETFKNAKTLDLRIPGIIRIRNGLVRSAKPTWSSQITESGYALWCRLALSVSGVFPATDVDLEEEGMSILGSSIDTITSYLS